VIDKVLAAGDVMFERTELRQFEVWLMFERFTGGHFEQNIKHGRGWSR
jgi:hypothetical protein